MKNSIYLFSILFTSLAFLSCEEKSDENEGEDESAEVTPESLKNSIKEMDDSLQVLFKKRMEEDNFKIDRLVYHEAINRNKSFFENFPEHGYAPRAVEKIASMYLQLNIEGEAVKWRDTILHNYPNYKNKLGVLELQKSYYDNFDTYEPEKIEYYCNEMLKVEGLSEEKKEEIEFRLEHIELSFTELIKMQNPDLEL
ncbi:MAG: hypothetical protein WED10_00705 [Brumimicrobium sp.]